MEVKLEMNLPSSLFEILKSLYYDFHNTEHVIIGCSYECNVVYV